MDRYYCTQVKPPPSCHDRNRGKWGESWTPSSNAFQASRIQCFGDIRRYVGTSVINSCMHYASSETSEPWSLLLLVVWFVSPIHSFTLSEREKGRLLPVSLLSTYPCVVGVFSFVDQNQVQGAMRFFPELRKQAAASSVLVRTLIPQRGRASPAWNVPRTRHLKSYETSISHVCDTGDLTKWKGDAIVNAANEGVSFSQSMRQPCFRIAIDSASSL